MADASHIISCNCNNMQIFFPLAQVPISFHVSGVRSSFCVHRCCNKSFLFVQVPMDVPRHALDMITKFTRNQSLVETNDDTIRTTTNVAAKSLGRKYGTAAEA